MEAEHLGDWTWYASKTLRQTHIEGTVCKRKTSFKRSNYFGGLQILFKIRYAVRGDKRGFTTVKEGLKMPFEMIQNN